MDERVVTFRVGVMVLATFIMAASLIVIFGDSRAVFSQKYSVYVTFPEAPGVTRDSPIRKSGILIGRVTEVEFDENDRVVVTARIDGNRRIRRTEVCRIKRSLLGDAVLEFVSSAARQQPGEYLGEGDTIEGEVVPDPLELIGNLEGRVATVMDSFEATSTEVGNLTRKINTLLEDNDEQFRRLVDKSERTLDLMHAALEDVNQMLDDPQMQADVRKSLAEFPQLLTDMREAAQGVRGATDRVESAFSSLDRNLQNMEAITEPLSQRGDSLVTRLDEGSEKLNLVLDEMLRFSRQLNNSEGTLAQLVHNPDLYQALVNAAENVEDLTHELRPIVRDARVFTDKLARHPEQLGVRGAIRPGTGIK